MDVFKKAKGIPLSCIPFACWFVLPWLLDVVFQIFPSFRRKLKRGFGGNHLIDRFGVGKTALLIGAGAGFQGNPAQPSADGGGDQLGFEHHIADGHRAGDQGPVQDLQYIGLGNGFCR